MVVAIPPRNGSRKYVGGDDQSGNYIPCDVGVCLDGSRNRNTDVISRPSGRRDWNDLSTSIAPINSNLQTGRKPPDDDSPDNFSNLVREGVRDAGDRTGQD